MKEKVIRPYSLYYCVAVILLVMAVVTELFHVPAAVVLVMFALLSTLYGMELHKEAEEQSNPRKIALWMCAVFIAALVFAPLFR